MTNLNGPTKKIKGEVFKIVYRNTLKGARKLLFNFPCMPLEYGKAIQRNKQFKMYEVYLKTIA